MLQAALKVFKTLPLDKKTYNYDTSDILKRTLKNGYVFTPEVLSHFPKKRMNEICDLVEFELLESAEEMNSTFHKSWNKVKTAPYLQLLLEQWFHYITTYGYEELGVYDESTVFIPNEKLEIPEIDEPPLLMIIDGLNKDDMKERLTKLLVSGIALADDTIDQIIHLFDFTGNIDIDKVKNKQVKMFLYKELGQVPENPVEFLRYVLYDMTGKSLLIKDSKTIEEIKVSCTSPLKLFMTYDLEFGSAPLASIFYRFKVLFLALRSNEAMKPIINRIRKLAKTYHEPMKEDYLNSVTERVKNKNLKVSDLRKALKKANVFRKIRLAYALKYRTGDVDSILYKIRNGKGYADEFSFEKTPLLDRVLKVVVDSIAEHIAPNVDGKKIYIPEYIDYALPYTEKQFTGYFPSGTSVIVDSDLIFGISWKNQDGNRIDLDLSLITADGKIGWDDVYRSQDRDILFSGDITDAPNGATELFYVKTKAQSNSLVYLNYFNYDEAIPVPFKIITAKKHLHSLKSNYMIDPNNVVAVTGSVIDQKAKVLGIISTTTKECRFYFSETYVGNSITSTDSVQSEQTKSYLVNFYKHSISFNKVLESAGAEIVKEKSDDVIDLSPESLGKDTILNLLT